MNIKRLAYVVRKPEEAFRMPMDYNAASYAPAAGPAPGPVGPVDRGTVVAAVERYLAARGIAVAAAPGGPSCGCETAAQPAAKAPAVAQAAISNVAAQVVDRFLARRAATGPKDGFS
jgi:hypothetical protein